MRYHAKLMAFFSDVDRVNEKEHIENIDRQHRAQRATPRPAAQRRKTMAHLIASAAFLAMGMLALGSIIHDLTRPIAA